MPTLARPPGPGVKGLHGDRRAFLESPTEFLTTVAREYGDVSYFRVGMRGHYLLSHPDLVKEALITRDANFHRGPIFTSLRHVLGENVLTGEGEFHRRQRRLMQPAFHHQRIQSYGRQMVEHALELCDSFREGEVREIHADMTRLTLGVVVRSLFGADLNGAQLESIMSQIAVVLEAYDRLGSRQATMESARSQEAMAGTDSMLFEMIEERRASGRDTGDLLSMLLLARDEEGDGGGMTDQQVRAELGALIGAGHDTTTNALTWTFYLLSQHPDIESRMLEELSEVLGDRALDSADLEGLPYLEAVVSESLRLYPPAWGIDRTVARECEAAGYRVPVGSVVFVSPYVLHHDARWFPEPERFDPARWLSDEARSRPRHAYVPFGAGPHMCIGKSFALQEISLVVATVARRWRLVPVPDRPVELQALITLHPRGGMPMRVEPREPVPGGSLR